MSTQTISPEQDSELVASVAAEQLGSNRINQQLLLYPVTAPNADHAGPLWDLAAFPIIDSQRAILTNYHDLFLKLFTHPILH